MSRAVFPLMDGVASTGSSNERARLDHVHPSDSSKASLKDLPSKLSDLQNDMTAEDFGALPDTTKYAESAEVGGAAKLTAGIPFGQVDSTSTSTAFTATVDGITELVDGVCVFLMNGVVTSASGFTIDINGLGAKPVYSTLAAATRATTLFNVAYTLLLVFNSKRVSGGCWDAYYGYDSNTNTIGYQLRTNSTTMPTLDKFYRYRLLFTAADRHHFVPANTSTSTNATASRTVNQRPIDPFGAIYYYGHTTAINANANPSTSYMWTQYNFNLGYSFNRTGSALTLANHAPVYIKCTPQSDGSAIIDPDTPYVQSLPSAADGKIFIHLGIASGAETVELAPVHPAYCFRNGQIRLWTGNVENELPAVTSEDAGKSLVVDDAGEWAAEYSSGGGGGGGSGILGTTPLTLQNDADELTLRGTGTISYEVSTPTIADFDISGGTTSQATLTQEDGFYVLSASASASAWYQTYIDITLTGLTVGTTYNFMADMQGIPRNESQRKTQGHYILYDGSGNTLATRGATDGAGLHSYSFTAPTTNVRLRWYPATNSTFLAGTSKAYCKAFYINREDTTAHTGIMNTSGSFSDETTIVAVPKGATISSTPSCRVYGASSGGGGELPLDGRKIVVFGDSIIGMFRDASSVPNALANYTGATAYNVGFGGCRMSDHPSHGYAEFSMWALAHAIATDTWTDQDTYVSQGSDYFPEQLATLKGIDFSTVDYAVIHYGTNDFGGGVPIGANASASTHDTLCGALRYSIETLLGAYPKLRIFVSLPIFRFWESGGTIVYSDTYTNSQNNTLVECVAAMKNVCTEYNIPTIDGYYELGVNKINATTFLTDGVHPAAVGRKRLGEFMGATIM